MTEPKKKDPLLANNWPTSAVVRCLRRKDRAQLIQFLRDRHQERFFEPIRCIRNVEGNEQGFGFAVMALCSLLVETIQSYRNGLPTTNPGELNELRTLKKVPDAYQLPAQLKVKGKDEFQQFFRDYREEFPGVCGRRFYENIRNGLLHQGQTKGRWTLLKQGPSVCDAKGRIIYRDQFSERLECCFERYLDDLANRTWSDTIWTNAARKVWWLIRLSRYSGKKPQRSPRKDSL